MPVIMIAVTTRAYTTTETTITTAATAITATTTAKTIAFAAVRLNK